MVTTRFAPSPTGYLHVGNLRTALMNWLIARKAGGRFLLRLDDTDPERSKKEYADAIAEDLEWLGLGWDAVFHQSERLDRYAAAADALRKSGRLYECFETPAELELKRRTQLAAGKPPVYDRAALNLPEADRKRLRTERTPHWRFKLDRERIVWADGILGEVSIDAASVSDPVLIRGDGQVLYTLASVVDDMEMEVTDIVRGSDHVTNTATQIQIIQALGGEPPRFAHHSLLTGAGGEALSKRLGTLALRDLRAQGVEPMALLSLLARLGSSDPVELRQDLGALAEGFEIGSFGAAPTKFNPDDLGPLSARFLHGVPLEAVAGDLAAIGVPDDQAVEFWAAISGNVATRAEIAEWWRICTGEVAPEIADEDADFVARALEMLPERPWGPGTWKAWTDAVKAETGRKGRALFMPLRKALTGRAHGPDMGDLMPLLRQQGQG
ncbi:glutamate--tRNA ligase [Amaricoccus macauensis]|uniref:glutamate--tRNA ligase n=1 Tax=Amaricoccus macauensis TaxID=57001 RepID=UPI003C7C1206